MKNIQPFVMVNNDLLATTRLNSTQKLFISYIIGWQKSNLTCRMTNRTLADHFGMKYAGIRSLLKTLNKLDFFETTQFGHTVDNSSWTSGHEIKVDETKLNEFLNAGKSEKNMAIEDVSSNSHSEDEIKQQDNIERLNVIKGIVEAFKPIDSLLFDIGLMSREEANVPTELLETLAEINCPDDECLEQMENDLITTSNALERMVSTLNNHKTTDSEPQMEDEILAENPHTQDETLSEPEQLKYKEITVANKEIQNDEANDFDAKNEITVPDDNETKDLTDVIETSIKYGYDERVDLFVVMDALGFNLEEYEIFRKHFITPYVPFKNLIDYLIDLSENQKKGDFSGVSVSDEVLDKMLDLIKRETINSR